MALSHLLEVAWDEFDKSLLSVGARYVLWGSFSNESELVASYFETKGKSNLIDRRRTEKSRSVEENQLVNEVHLAASQISEYLNWARNQGGGQPILREALVSYCVAFEACLKNVAVAFNLAKTHPNGLDGVAYIPDAEFKQALKQIKQGWQHSNVSGQFRAKVFYSQYLIQTNPSVTRFPFGVDPADDDWSNCWAAFDLRNAIVHQMARPSEQISLADTVFEIHREIELKPVHLRIVGESMRNVLGPLNPYYLLPL